MVAANRRLRTAVDGNEALRDPVARPADEFGSAASRRLRPESRRNKRSDGKTKKNNSVRRSYHCRNQKR